MSVLAQLREHGLRLSAAGDALRVQPREALTDELRAVIRSKKPDILRELAIEAGERQGAIFGAAPLSTVQKAARQQVLTQLATNPQVQRSFVNRFEDGAMVVTLAIRKIGTCELLIPAERFNASNLDDYAAMLECLTEDKGSCAS